MGEGRFVYDVKALGANPNVAKVSDYELVLQTQMRIQLFKEWKKSMETDAIRRMLIDSGLTEELIGPGYADALAEAFKTGGMPCYTTEEAANIAGYKERNPLLISGKFERKGKKGVVMTQDFEQALFSVYPEISVEDAIRAAGLDTLDVGRNRIYRIITDFDNRLRYLHKEIEAEAADNKARSSKEDVTGCVPETHPYIKSADGGVVLPNETFYNEASFLPDMPIDEILEIYGMDAAWFSPRNIKLIVSKLSHWTIMPSVQKTHTTDANEIQFRRMNAMNRFVAENLKKIGMIYSSADPDKKIVICRGLYGMPRDPWGFYTQERIFVMTGIKRSTFYKILGNEDYGAGIRRQRHHDETDIEMIKEVLAYKGFEKGVRQIYMLMPKVTGVSMGLSRIRRLMNKYGIHTSIRRPGKNRKAMKELIERNRQANILMQQFRLHRPNEVRLTDVTYLDYGGGKRAYGSASIDPVTGKLVCFVVSQDNDLKLALDTLEAMDRYPAKNGAVLHSDQGILYMTDDFQAAVVEKNMVQSMSRRGNCWDNAPQEAFFGHFKDECRYEKCRDIEDLKTMVDEYGRYYNEERGVWEHGRMTPLEYEKYLEDMPDDEFLEYLEAEKEKYRQMKQRAAQKAIDRARAEKEAARKKKGAADDGRSSKGQV